MSSDLQRALQKMFRNVFDTADVEVTNDATNDNTLYTLTFDIVVSEDGNYYDLRKSTKYEGLTADVNRIISSLQR